MRVLVSLASLRALLVDWCLICDGPTLEFEGFPIVYKVGARSVGFMAQGHVYDDVSNAFQLEVLNPKVCLLQAAAVRHVVALSSVSCLGEEPLQVGQ